MTAGQEADCSNYGALMEVRDSDPAIMLTDKGYDSDPIRQDLRDRGTVPEIPTKRNRRIQHSVSRPLYALRSRIECFINRLKNSRRLATRYEQTDDSFLGFAALVSIRLWIRFVHATWRKVSLSRKSGSPGTSLRSSDNRTAFTSTRKQPLPASRRALPVQQSPAGGIRQEAVREGDISDPGRAAAISSRPSPRGQR